MNSRDRILWLFLSIFSIGGLALAIQLTRIHYFTHTDPAYEALCAVNERINCETVALSPYSIFLGVPISVWGAITYLGLLGLGIWGLLKRSLTNHPPVGVLFALSSASLLASGLLAYISITKIASICLFCNGLYLVNLGLFGISVVWLKRVKLTPWSALREELLIATQHPMISTVLVLAGTAAIVSIIFFFPKYWKESARSGSVELSRGITPSGDHWIGAATPEITILEFTDYECPFCRKAHRQVRSLLAAHPNRARLLHKHLPLDQSCNKSVPRPFHLRACEFSRFALCAGEQNRFWEANDAIFSALDHERAPNIDLDRIAIRLGLDRPELEACLTSTKTENEIQQDIEEGIRRGIRGTPTYFVGEKGYEGMIPPGVIEDRR